MSVKASGSIFVFLLFLLTAEASLASQAIPDTSVINKRSREAYAGARRNPDISILLAQQSLNDSRKMDYRRGVADASLALGMAYLAKYNRGDSALYYNDLALASYEEIGDIAGQARACYGLSYVYSFKGDLVSSEKFSNMSLQYFEKAGDHRGMINSLNALSYLARQQQDLEKATAYIKKAISTASEVKDTLPLADATNSLGNIYKEMALFSQAIDTYFEALKLWEMKGDSAGMSIAYGSIGLAYYYQKNYSKALEYSLKHLILSEKRGDLWEMAKMCNNIAQIYNSRNVYDSALIFHRRSLALNRQISLATGEADACFNIASTMLHLGQRDSAYWYSRKAVEIAKAKGISVPPSYYVTLGNVEQSLGKYRIATDNALTAYSLAKEKELPLPLSDAALLLSDIYGKTGREEMAYRYLREYMQLKDSISNDEFLKQVTRMEIQYDFDKKQKAAEYEQMQEKLVRDQKIKQQRLYLRGLAILLILVALISLLYLRHNRLMAKYSQIDLEQRLLRAQMNPHFIFNSLCAIQNLILAEKPQKANAFLTKIAGLMRNILENSREEYIPLEKEIETLRYYMDVQQLRFEKGFEYNISVDQSIDPENISVPPMLAQPCVENSIEHGLLPGRENGRVSISYSLRGGLIMLEVTDNGIGRKKAAAETRGVKKQSISTKLTEKRLEHFRKILKEKEISFEINDLFDGEEAAGTKVVMMLPYKRIYA
ncbi:MAG: histidine kinase [Bacteroidales bacterium]